MKSSYELAMERLNKTAPIKKLSAGQKAQLAEIDSRCAAKLAERELLLNGELAKAQGSGDYEAMEQLAKQLASERRRIAAESEEKKEKVRNAG